jgi:hypothetical protein
MTFFCLFTQVTKKSIFRETWCTHIEYQEVGVFVQFFFTFQIFFPMTEAYAPMWQTEFPCSYRTYPKEITNTLIGSQSKYHSEFPILLEQVFNV